MNAIDEKRAALRLLDGLEAGGLSPADATIIASDLDPVYIYVIVSFLRAIYPASDPAAGPVLERVVQLTSSSPTVVNKHRDGEQDPVSRWLETEYPFNDHRGRGPELIELIADKLDS